jgi:hypothetical protein
MLSADRLRDFSGSVVIISFPIIPVPEIPLYFGCREGWIRLAKSLAYRGKRGGLEGEGHDQECVRTEAFPSSSDGEAKRKCRDGRLRPSRSRSDPDPARHNHDCQSLSKPRSPPGKRQLRGAKDHSS